MRGCHCRFFSQLFGQAAAFGDELHQVFRHVRVEAVDHEEPFGGGVGVHGASDVRDELRFGTGRLQRWADDHPRHHVETGGQRRRPVPRVFEFLLRYAVGLGRLVGGVPLDGLQRGRLVHAHRVRAGAAAFAGASR